MKEHTYIEDVCEERCAVEYLAMRGSKKQEA
jgi:hypothetical protein